jgi:hypothetical protein
VAYSDTLHLLHQALCAITYWQIAFAIKMASKVGVFVNPCLFACCPGSCWGNTEQVVVRWRHPVVSKVALDTPHWRMPFILPRRTTVAIKMANNLGAFVCHQYF